MDLASDTHTHARARAAFCWLASPVDPEASEPPPRRWRDSHEYVEGARDGGQTPENSANSFAAQYEYAKRRMKAQTTHSIFF